MGNHWHLVVEVAFPAELGRWLHWLCQRHAWRHHQVHPALGRGHVYQGRFKSFPIQDEGHLYAVLRYVEANPLRAGLVAQAQDWPWSSLSSAPVRHGLLTVARPPLVAWRHDAASHLRNPARTSAFSETAMGKFLSPFISLASALNQRAARAKKC